MEGSVLPAPVFDITFSAQSALPPEDAHRAEVAAIPSATTDPQEMLRIEIQTRDPNIRIIWLSPKGTDSLPTKAEASSK